MSNKTKPTDIDILCESYYRWCMEVVADSLKVDPILGTGKAKPLAPSEFKQALHKFINEEIIGKYENITNGMTESLINDKLAANHLRNKQRQRLNKAFGVEE